MPAGVKPTSRYDLLERAREMKLGPNYKWIALSNTTLGAMMAAIDSSILIISLPAIFNGLGVNPLISGDTSLLLWLVLGYTIISAVTVVTIGRLSDMFGRVRLYNLGFLIFTIASILLCVSTYMISGTTGAMMLIVLRLFQGLGGGFLIANGAAILTDAFPENERGMALGINQIAAIGGSLVGMLVGGVLAAIDWHFVFLVSVPVGVIGTLWAYMALKELAVPNKERKLDILGNLAFAGGVFALIISMVYALQPYGSSSIGWSNPVVLGGVALGILLLITFVLIESKTTDPMFRLWLFKIRAFAAGNISLLLSGIARGGLQFMLIIWLQGIWLPLHGVSFEHTPLIAALDMIPLILGFLIAGPVSGYLSDKYGARLFCTLGMIINVIGFLSLASLPVNFDMVYFEAIIFIMGIGQGMFAAPNTAAIMNSVPPKYRGVTSGMRATLMNLALVFSITIFFSLLTLGVSSSLPGALHSGLVAQNVSNATATQISKLPPSAALFAALLGYNPMKILIPANVIDALPAHNANVILGNDFFPELMENSFMDGMKIVLYVGALMAFIAAVCSALRGERYVYRKLNRKIAS